MLGFIFEVVVFTFVLIYWHRNVERDREILQLKLINQQQENNWRYSKPNNT
ncbi:MAG: hypothetical protein IPL65_19330 [Lewinellaceae bacterium]|nr:hypothetical protein [Lewinellaceae bacterium]